MVDVLVFVGVAVGKGVRVMVGVRVGVGVGFGLIIPSAWPAATTDTQQTSITTTQPQAVHFLRRGLDLRQKACKRFMIPSLVPISLDYEVHKLFDHFPLIGW